jgi:hypothetical protein
MSILRAKLLLVAAVLAEADAGATDVVHQNRPQEETHLPEFKQK